MTAAGDRPPRPRPVALVTGANRGIGLEVARQLGRRDFHVVLTARRVDAGREAASRLAKTLDTNTIGALRVVQAFLPYLRASDGARVINVSSEAGSLAAMGSYAPAYSISKAALNALTRQLAAALAPDKIPVNSVCPGWVRTDMGGPRATLSVEEGADTIVWLATEAPRRLTGGFLSKRKPAAW